MRSAARPGWSPPTSAFAGFRFPPEVIVVAIRWYLRFNLSYRDVEELLVDRGVEVDHVTVFRWVQRFTPLLADAARFVRHAPGDRWFGDETYLRINGVWRYVYRAIDQYGQVIDVLVSPRRDAATARRFFRRALTVLKVMPVEVVTDAAPTTQPSSASCSRRRGITSNDMPTIRSRPITASSSTGSDRCAGCARNRPHR
jgi:IS6 family transposase